MSSPVRTGRRSLPTPPSDADFTSRLRSAAVAARIGVWLGIAFGICFVTGLISHYAQNPTHPIPFPTSPAWGYRVTQGLHVITGVASIPLLLVKLWTVFPLLLRRPERSVRALVLDGLEKVSILGLVSSAIFLLATGVLNTSQWYPWSFSFRSSHYAMAWIATGSLVLHIAVKLPVIRSALGADIDATVNDRPSATAPGALSRRGLLRTTWLAAGVAALSVAGGTVPFLRRVSVFAVRDGEGPQGVPINKTASAARISDEMVGDAWRLEVLVRFDDPGLEATVFFDRDQLLAMSQHTERLPIACVEGWSANADWTGVRLRDLLDELQAARGRDVVVTSLQSSGPFRSTVLPADFVDDPRTLLALALNGEPLSRDHGEPIRLIAPNRPGVLQTKWLARLEVSA